ncbi:MAG: LLM class flavin-dependent oxidoreductase [Streptomyces sp.]|jgi:alkanesulfonate monooxygenase SsuD/methylene tetrahydromethanopterin reductase-like flavin-dependent oxidoreductase (luciferase family)|nr:LLM class flavin-dependent oxidoreductase [Streptomyces sp.]
MQLGIGLPGYLGDAIEPRAVLDWARVADAAGFHGVAAHDRPAHDTWDPMATLAAVAGVTERVRLATTALLLPPRDEVLVAKQAAVIDCVSGGRLDLGVALGNRPDDYEVLGRPFQGRGRRLDEQLRRLVTLWDAAAERKPDAGTPGPAPIQRPHPPLWVGGYAPAAIGRAVALGDGYLFGAPGVEAIGSRLPAIRRAATDAGRERFPIGALAYVALSTDPGELEQAERLLTHYYGTLHRPFAQMVHAGDADRIRSTLDDYRRTGLDVLYLFPVIPAIGQLERWAEELLPHADS